MDDLLQDFIAETRETLEALAGEIVAWESDPTDRARLDAIFRFVHTVKGSCGFLDLPRLARLSHAAEDVLGAVRAGARRPDKRLVDAVLAVVDRIGELVEAIDAGASLDDGGEDLLVAALAEEAEPAAASAAPVSAATAPARAATRSVRLSVDLLDRMMRGMSDMVLARNELARRVRDEASDPALEAALDRLSATVAEMRDTVTRTRMQKVEALFSPLPRMVRDTAASAGKQVVLTVDGADVELDREMIEMMRDPLVHMVRNAIDHGFETPAERRTLGKREAGRLTVGARQSGNRIIIDIADDGRGIDVERVLAKAIARDPAREPQLRALSARGKLDLIFEAGVSSCDEVTALSGRGVGMDVVRANVEQIGGRIELANRPGRGLAVSIEVPLTLAILATVIVRVGSQRLAVPRSAIKEIVSTRNEAIRVDRLGGTRLATIRGQRLALVDLADLLGVATDRADPPMLAIVDVPGGTFALGIDAVLDTEELVVKPASPTVMAAGVYAGQTLPDSGLPLLLLDCARTAAAAGLSFERHDAVEEAEPVVAEPGLPVFLFDDLDGRRRVIPLGAVDRVERVELAVIADAGGSLRLVDGGRIVPLVATGPLPTTGRVPVLRLHDSGREVGYAIRDALDIAALDAPLAPSHRPGAVLGVSVLAGDAVEVLDPLWILAQAGAVTRDSPRRTVGFVAGPEAAWMTTFLAPALEAAGYRVVPHAGTADLALAMEGNPPPTGGAAPLLTLSREPDGGVYCYDRVALIDAVARRLEARA